MIHRWSPGFSRIYRRDASFRSLLNQPQIKALRHMEPISLAEVYCWSTLQCVRSYRHQPKQCFSQGFACAGTVLLSSQICHAPIQHHRCFYFTSGIQNMVCSSRSLSRTPLSLKPSDVKFPSSSRAMAKQQTAAMQGFEILIQDGNQESMKNRKKMRRALSSTSSAAWNSQLCQLIFIPSILRKGNPDTIYLWGWMLGKNKPEEPHWHNQHLRRRNERRKDNRACTKWSNFTSIIEKESEATENILEANMTARLL